MSNDGTSAGPAHDTPSTRAQQDEPIGAVGLMADPRSAQSWRLPSLALAGLLAALAVIGIAGILINRGVTEIVEQAIRFDVELEDNADDLRVAILDVRHYHRDLLFNDPAPQRVEEWEQRYREMVAQIEELDALYRSGLGTADLPSTAELRDVAEAYYAEFRPEVDAYDPDDPVRFQQAADANLWPLQRLQTFAEQLDMSGEERAANAFADVEAAVATGTLALVGVLIGLGIVGLALAASVFGIIQQQRRLIAGEQSVAEEQAAASRAKSEFIADASHELRTPLTVLRGNAEIALAIEANCEHADGTREALREIVTESVRMARLVDDLLFLARSDVTAVPLDLQPIEADALMSAVAGRAAMLARERGATLRSRLDASGTISVDAARIEQAILILVDNAAKYGPAGGTIELTTSHDGTAFLIEVRDQGPGIREPDLARVFDRYYRVEDAAPTRRAVGAGLGLSIASAIIESHRGRIFGSSPESGGTVMTIRLPLVSPEIEHEQPVAVRTTDEVAAAMGNEPR
jgi:signal transduction histidine kinase